VPRCSISGMIQSAAALLVMSFALLATEPNAATRRWWSYTEALANDNMAGRDTGSAGYVAAETFVIQHFEDAGLSPAGTHGFKQPVPLHSLKLDPESSPVRIARPQGETRLDWFRQITIAIRPNLPTHIRGSLYFVGDPATAQAGKLAGAVVVRLGPPRIRKPGAPPAAKVPDGVAAVITIDSLAGPEPPIWPVPYAAVVSLRDGGTQTRVNEQSAPEFRFNPSDAELLFAGSGHSFAEVKTKLDGGESLANFPLAGTMETDLTVKEENFVSDNVLGVLGGSDPKLRNEYVVLSAHLDGYGKGEARNGDSVYNGALDDAAYVALLMDLAQTLHENGTRLKRSLLFCIVTGEEKGLLGSQYFAAHPTVPKHQLVADLNLDQLRPIFPLNTLTILALNESTLGDAVRRVAEPMGIRIQPDPEPERNLLRRSDHFSFMQVGVPAVNFVFGYQKGSAEEKVYRAWYAERYHSPADDLQQPWVPEAAAKFNAFYAALVKEVANAPERPHWLESPFARSTH
jgi:hypothetical protein